MVIKRIFYCLVLFVILLFYGEATPQFKSLDHDTVKLRASSAESMMKNSTVFKVYHSVSFERLLYMKDDLEGMRRLLPTNTTLKFINQTQNATDVESAYAMRLEAVCGFVLFLLICLSTLRCMYQLLKYRGDPNRLSEFVWKEWLFCFAEHSDIDQETSPQYRKVVTHRPFYPPV